MFLQVFGGVEVHTAAMSSGSAERHFINHGSVRTFILYRTGGAVGRLPGAHSAWREIDVAAQCALIGFFLFLERVIVVGKKLLRHVHIDLAFVLSHKLVPADMPRVGAGAHIMQVETGLFAGELGTDGEV